MTLTFSHDARPSPRLTVSQALRRAFTPHRLGRRCCRNQSRVVATVLPSSRRRGSGTSPAWGGRCPALSQAATSWRRPAPSACRHHRCLASGPPTIWAPSPSGHSWRITPRCRAEPGAAPGVPVAESGHRAARPGAAAWPAHARGDDRALRVLSAWAQRPRCQPSPSVLELVVPLRDHPRRRCRGCSAGRRQQRARARAGREVSPRSTARSCPRHVLRWVGPLFTHDHTERTSPKVASTPRNGRLGKLHQGVVGEQGHYLARRAGRRPGCAPAGSHLLSPILAQATGSSVLDYAGEKLFIPLGISTDKAP
jgi:hypothetical protein